MSDPRMADQPSQEEMRAYLDQLREADAAGLVAEAFNLLATGAQVKLGRPDARTLIDALAALVEAVDDGIPAQIATQMRQGVGQLQVAQVEAERDAAASPAPADGEDDRAATAGRGAADGAAPAGTAREGGAGPGGQKMTDRLWIPGRDPRPPGG